MITDSRQRIGEAYADLKGIDWSKIDLATKRCRAAFAKYPKATFAWCCHHEQLFELLTEPAEARIKYILENKCETERVTRLNNFRPVQDERKFKPALAEYDKVRQTACAEYDKVRQTAWAEYDKVRQTAWAEYDKVCQTALAEYDKVRQTALAEYDKVYQTARKPFLKLYWQDVPLGTWNGQSIFKK